MKRTLSIVAVIVGLSAVAAADNQPVHHQSESTEDQSALGLVPIPLFNVESTAPVEPVPAMEFVFEVTTPEHRNDFEFWLGFEPMAEQVWRSIDPGVDQTGDSRRPL